MKPNVGPGLLLGERGDRDLVRLQNEGRAARITVDWFQLGCESESYHAAWLSSDQPTIRANGVSINIESLSEYQWIFHKQSSMVQRPLARAQVGSRSENRFATREWNALVESALLVLRDATVDRWVTPYGQRDYTDCKLYILNLASNFGLNVPLFHVGTEFLSPPGSTGVIAKAINCDALIERNRYFATTPVTDEQQEELFQKRSECPTLLQHRIECVEEWRIFYVRGAWIGRTLQVAGDEIDIRYQSAIQCGPLKLSEGMSRGLEQVCKTLGMTYCAFDVLVDRERREWLIDVTPNGSWWWYEDATGANISREILAALCG